MEEAAATLIPTQKRESLMAWCNLYLGIEGRGGSDNTFLAKKRDLEASSPSSSALPAGSIPTSGPGR